LDKLSLHAGYLTQLGVFGPDKGMALRMVRDDYKAAGPEDWFLFYQPGAGMSKAYPAGKPRESLDSQVRPLRSLGP